jgi:hypothetical protein
MRLSVPGSAGKGLDGDGIGSEQACKPSLSSWNPHPRLSCLFVHTQFWQLLCAALCFCCGPSIPSHPGLVRLFQQTQPSTFFFLGAPQSPTGWFVSPLHALVPLLDHHDRYRRHFWPPQPTGRSANDETRATTTEPSLIVIDQSATSTPNTRSPTSGGGAGA